MSEKPQVYYEFGPFRLDEQERKFLRDGMEMTLRENGRDERLPPKTFDLLLALVKQTGRMLKREELLEQVWPDTFVEDNRLSDNISILRRFLGDSAKNPNFIETVPKHGYRFLAEVREVRHEGVALFDQTKTRVLIEEDDQSTSASAIAAPGPRFKARISAFVILLVLLIGVGIGVAIYLRRSQATASHSPINSIAVLPFKPLVANQRDESLELGMAETLITRLSAVDRLAVRPTSAVRKYTSLEDETLKAGPELGVDAVLDGSIQNASDRVRVTVRLVEVKQGKTLWAEQFDEKFTDIFAVQDAIARRVVGALSLKLSGEENTRLTKRYTENGEAYRLYLTGRYFWNKRTAEGFAKAIDYYQQALAADPNYALAHAGLAESYVLLPNWTGAPPEESFTRAEQSARRALELDPRLAEAYTALGAVKIYLNHDWAGGGEDYRRAVELNPNYATARQWYGEWLCSAGRLAEALAEAEAAQRLDPVSSIVAFEFGVALYYARRPVEAEAQFRKVLELEPGFFRAHVFLSRIYFDQGRDDESIRERALVLARGDGTKAAQFEVVFRTAYRSGGREAYLRKQLEMRNEPGIFHANRVGGWVESCALLRDKDCTFEALREVERTRHPLIDSIKVDPYLDFLRADPRYAELLRRLGLPA